MRHNTIVIWVVLWLAMVVCVGSKGDDLHRVVVVEHRRGDDVVKWAFPRKAFEPKVGMADVYVSFATYIACLVFLLVDPQLVRSCLVLFVQSFRFQNQTRVKRQHPPSMPVDGFLVVTGQKGVTDLKVTAPSKSQVDRFGRRVAGL